MPLRPCGSPGFTILAPGQFRQTLAGKLIPCVDKIRDLYTALGVRNYIIRLVWTTWSGGERGMGIEQLVKEELLLPTPLIGDISSLEERAQAVGADEFGTIIVSEVSGRYTEDYLCGRNGAEPIPDDQNFYYEIEFVDSNGRWGQGIRRRFSLNSAPSYDPDTFQWQFQLSRAGEDRGRDGSPED